MMRGLSALCAAATLVMPAWAGAPQWPEVKETTGEVHVIYVANAEPNAFELEITRPGCTAATARNASRR